MPRYKSLDTSPAMLVRQSEPGVADPACPRLIQVVQHQRSLRHSITTACVVEDHQSANRSGLEGAGLDVGAGLGDECRLLRGCRDDHRVTTGNEGNALVGAPLALAKGGNLRCVTGDVGAGGN